ncbi:tetratricopeptide repeat protein [candidate division WOR-3 bacterium]|uniref:Tetratricopeptide repeat protein n=1 Tax=candidate division WOR-3 bacterium TaxID=2052148 RepID=A0A9D5KAN3_UNCW3|nr:tetratricopeptide repeat protein [candidate division WOR-3 bacterium]MBD3364645.1 tetratricopeptide repeat protein [candidate division WOR-3 bacterium]
MCKHKGDYRWSSNLPQGGGVLRKSARLRLRPFIPLDMIPSGGDYVSTGGDKKELTLLLADITGFTELSERLAVQGSAGSEELTSILNSSFEKMLSEIDLYGGIVIFFSGDAIFSIFPGTDDQTRLRALTCASRIREEIRKLSPVKSSIGKTDLRISIALHAGELNDFRLGGEERVVRVLTGDAANILYRCERMTAPDTIRLMPPVAEGIHEKLNLSLSRESLELTGIISASPEAAAPELPDELGRGLTALLPCGLADRLTSMPDEKSILEEHSYGSVMFVNFYDIPHDFETYNTYFNTAWRIVHKFGGVVEKIDLDSYGDRLMAVFGTPNACEDDAKRAVFAARELMSNNPAGAAQRIGISSGPLFSCVIGSNLHRTFTVMGHTVILAARQLESADEGEIRVGERTYQQTSSSFKAAGRDAVAPFGKETGEGSWLLGERRIDQEWSNPPDKRLIGRELKITRLREIADDVRQSKRGFAVTILGEAGIGKTRLVQEFAGWARKNGFVVAGGRCASYGKETPYLCWSDLLQTLLAEGEEGVSRETLMRAMDSVERPAWAPILAPYLGLCMDENEFTSTLDPSARKQKMFALILELMLRYGQENPLLLVFENVQWIDSLSRELIASLFDLLPSVPLMVILLTRPIGEVFPWHFLPIHLEMRLFPLAEKEANLLALERLGSRTVDTLLLKLIHDTSQGNPLYIEEFTKLLLSKDSLERTGAKISLKKKADMSQIPPTIHRVISSRIDLLNERAKGILRAGAVIGNRFDFQILNRIQDIANGEALKRQLGLLAYHDLVKIIEDKDSSTYEFRNMLIREVAYSTLSFAKRRTYHRRIAEMLEKKGEPEQVLVHHYQHTSDKGKTLSYLVGSGDRAAKAFANEEALTFYDEALDLLDKQKELSNDIKRFQLLLKRENVLSHIGDRKAQRRDLNTLLSVALSAEDEHMLGIVLFREAAYRQATGNLKEALAKALKAEEILSKKPEPSQLLSVQRIISLILQSLGRYTDALKRLEKARDMACKSNNISLEARVEVDFGQVYKQLGEYRQAIPFFQKGLKLFRTNNDQNGEIMTAAALGVVYKYLGLYKQAISAYEKALKQVSQIGDKKAEERILNNLGIVMKYLGEYDKALLYCHRALQTARTIHDRHGEGILLDTIGNIKRAQGHFEEAIESLEMAIEIAEGTCEKPVQLKHLSNLATVYTEVGFYSRALELLEESLSMAEELGDAKSQGLCLDKIGMIYYEQGRHEEASDFIKKSVDIFEKTGADMLQLQCKEDLAEVYIASGNYKKAIVLSEEILGLARTKGLIAEEAKALRIQAEYKLTQRDPHGAFFLVNKSVKLLKGEKQTNQEVTFTYYKVLRGLGKQDAAAEILEELYSKVINQAEAIGNADMKDSYLSNVSINKKIVEAWEMLGARESK